MWKWLNTTDTLHHRRMEREFSNKLNEVNDKIFIRSSMKIRSSIGSKSDASSFHWRSLPAMSKENNKNFHIFPDDINFLSEIVANNKIKILPMEFSETEEYFYRQLEEWKSTINHYESMIKSFK